MDAPSPRRYLDDLALNEPFPIGGFTLSLDEIRDFAARYDPQPFHLDEEAAARSYFQGLSASGLHTQAAAVALMVRATRDLAVIAGWSLHEARFFVPVRPDTPYDVTAFWSEVRPSARNPARGNASIVLDITRAADGVKVARCGVTFTLERRPALSP